jgi:hypothetical protein
MGYINGGVRSATTNTPIASKAALKRAVVADPADVMFFCTSELGEVFNGRLTETPESAKLQVVGPDPYTNRRWYATVTRDAAGTIKVA